MKILLIVLIFSFTSTLFADFTHVETPKADVIIVVDDSGSMDFFQEKLSNNLDTILADFKGVDTHFGILTTSLQTFSGSTSYVPGVFIGDGLSGSYEQVIDQLKGDLLVGSQGSYDEKAFSSVLMALSSPFIDNENKGFLRKDTPLIVVVISDEPEQSDVSAKEFTDQLIQIKGDKDITLYGYISLQKTNGCGFGGLDTKLPEAVNILGGKLYNICEDDWSKNKIIFNQ